MDLQFMRHPRRTIMHPARHLNWRSRRNDCLGIILREDGSPPADLRSWMHVCRISRMALDDSRLFATPFNGGVTCMDLDKTEDRYLLVGAADTSFAVFDTHIGSEKAVTHMSAVFSFRRNTRPGAHKFMISSVAWYPVDSGLFVTGSHDCSVKVWDTNELEVVAEFQLPKKVSSVAMSSVATGHTLIATGCEDTQVRLCDPASGAVTHVYSGHRDAVWCVAWSATSEYEVLSGGGEGQVRVWDIRRAGCRAVLDQYTTKRPARAASEERPHGATESAGSPAKRQRCGSGTMHGSSSAPALLGPTASGASRMKESAVRAHSGAVTCVLPCPDAVSLLTAGNDGRLRLWDAQYRYNKLAGYEGTYNRAIRARQMAVTNDARVVFYPTGSCVNIYEVESGHMLASLQGGHSESINCCVYNPSLNELYTGANDQRVRVWSCVAGSRKVVESELDAGREDCRNGPETRRV